LSLFQIHACYFLNDRRSHHSDSGDEANKVEAHEC
jgi:hypothetical protein